VSKVLEELIVKIKSEFDPKGFNSLSHAMAQANLQSGKTQQKVGKTTTAVNKTSTAVNNLSSKFSALNGPLWLVTNGLSSMLGAASAVAGIFGIGAIVSAVQSASMELVTFAARLDGIQVKFRAVLGDAKLGNQEFQWLEQTASSLKMNILDAADAYALFYAAAEGTAGKDTTRQIFKSWLEINRVMHLSPQIQERVMYALREMYSKGTVYTQDLIRQLGSAIPGTTELASKAMGVTPAELKDMLARGEVKAAEFVPKFTMAAVTKFASPNAIKDSIKQIDAGLQHLTNTIYFMKKELLDAGARDVIKNLLIDMASLFNTNQLESFVKLLGSLLKNITGYFAPVFEKLGGIINSVLSRSNLIEGFSLLDVILKSVADSLYGFLSLMDRVYQTKEYTDFLEQFYMLLNNIVNMFIVLFGMEIPTTFNTMATSIGIVTEYLKVFNIALSRAVQLIKILSSGIGTIEDRVVNTAIKFVLPGPLSSMTNFLPEGAKRYLTGTERGPTLSYQEIENSFKNQLPSYRSNLRGQFYSPQNVNVTIDTIALPQVNSSEDFLDAMATYVAGFTNPAYAGQF